MNNKKGLGRGLGALLSIFEDVEEPVVQPQNQTPVAPQAQETVQAKSQEPVQETQVATPPVQPAVTAEQPQPQSTGVQVPQTPPVSPQVPQAEFSPQASQEIPQPVPTAQPQPAPQQQFTAPQNPYMPQTPPVSPQAMPHNPYMPQGFMPSQPQPQAYAPAPMPEFNEEAFARGVNEVPIELLEVNPNQPRKYFNEISLAELAESIKIHGIIQPIVVNAIYGGKYMIIAGERRYRAAKLIGLRTVPCVLKDYTERQVKEIALIENLQREDLNPIEAARAIKQLMEEYNFTQEVVADRIGKARPTVTNLLRLLNLTPEVIALVEQGQLTAGHAKNLVVVLDKNLQMKLAQTIISKKLSVREVEKLVREVMRPKRPNAEKKPEQSPELINFTEELQRVFSTKVVIQGNDNRGRISIDYFSKDDLDRIFELIELLKNKKLTLEDLSNFNKRNNDTNQ